MAAKCTPLMVWPTCQLVDSDLWFGNLMDRFRILWISAETVIHSPEFFCIFCVMYLIFGMSLGWTTVVTWLGWSWGCYEHLPHPDRLQELYKDTPVGSETKDAKEECNRLGSKSCSLGDTGLEGGFFCFWRQQQKGWNLETSQAILDFFVLEGSYHEEEMFQGSRWAALPGANVTKW